MRWMCWWWRDMDSSRCPSRAGLADLFLDFFVEESRDSISASNASICVCSSSTELFSHSLASSLACSFGSFLSLAASSPCLENAFVFVSFSHTLNCSIFVSMSLRASSSGVCHGRRCCPPTA